MHQKIRLFSLVFLIVAAIDSIRNLPAAALFGSSLIFFFLFSALVFLIPVALLSAEFSSRYPEEGGIFHWVRHAFGEKCAFFAVWLQWINTMVWYPTILAFIAGTAAYLFDPALAQSKGFLILVILIVFWGLTLLNLKGIHVSARINTFCGLIGTIFPIFFLIGLGVFWAFQGNAMQMSFHLKDLIPSFDTSDHWVALVAIMASFLGMELSGVHVNDVVDPQKNFPKAMGWSVFILLFTMLFGALSIGTVIPEKEIRLVDGIMQTFTQFFSTFHMEVAVPILAFLILIGSIGGMINWLVSPAKGLLQAAEHGFLPQFFLYKNERKVPVRILIIQAVLVSCFCLCLALVPTINVFYWFLMALSTGLYMLMYVLMFLAALKLGRPARSVQTFRIMPGIRTFFCIAGLFGSTLTIVVGFFPPEGIQVQSPWIYICLIGLGNIVLIAPAALLCFFKRA
jgi:amino acid transporter